MSTSVQTFELADNNLSANETTTLSIVFENPVIGFDESDLFVNKGVVIENFTSLGDGKTFTATLTAIPGPDNNGEATVFIKANDYFDAATGLEGDRFDIEFNVDTTLPLEPIIVLPTPSGGNGEYNIDDANDNGTITATINLPSSTNEFETTKPGDLLTVNNVEYTVTQDMIDNGLQVEVNPDSTITASIVDAAGNSGDEVSSPVASADLERPDAPTVIITEDANNDGTVSYVENETDTTDDEGNINYIVTVSPDAEIGDTLTVNGMNIAITQAIIDSGYEASVPPVDGESIEITATVTDQAGNISTVAQDNAVVDLTIPDAAPIFLWHLGYNLNDTQGPSDQRGKSGGKYGTDVNYETGILNDYVYIGYDGFDSDGQLIKSKLDGDFERDCGDGDVVWKMETYAGNDYVQIREDQNAYTVAALGSGDDTYYVQGALDSNFVRAQSNPEARSYIFTETGNDAVVVGGNGDGKVTGWGIDGGRIFTGSGSDNVTVYGEMDDGGVIDLGAGRTEFVTGNEVLNADTLDAAGDVNNLTITHNLGDAPSSDFGHIFGGLGNDNVSIGTNIQGYSIVDLGEGTNSIDVGNDITGRAQIIAAGGNDTLTIDDDIQLRAQVNLGDGDNVINIGSTAKGNSLITTGNGSDVLNIADSMWNRASANLGDGDDVVSIGDNMYYQTSVNLESGNDTLSVTHMHGSSHIDAGTGNDNVTILETMHHQSTVILGEGDDTLSLNGMHSNSNIDAGSGNDTITYSGGKLYGTIDGGVGEDTLILTYDKNDSLVSYWLHDTHVTTKDFTGIEMIEMTGQNVVDIRFEDLLQDLDREGALYIQGDDSSKVDLGSTNWNSDDASRAKFDDRTSDGDWTLNSSTVVDGVNYDVYHNSAATDNLNDVYIEQGIVVI